MKLRHITAGTIAKVLRMPVYVKRTVDREMVKKIIDKFMYCEVFVAEVTLDEEDKLNQKNIYKAFEEYIKNNHIKAGVFQRQERIFLRNDELPLYCTTWYPKTIVEASKKNRMNFVDTDDKEIYIGDELIQEELDGDCTPDESEKMCGDALDELA